MWSRRDSANTQAPDFGRQYPIYPELPQLNRVTGPALVGTSPPIYPAITQQWVPPLGIRDREASYVVEPNSIPLGPGIYDCRLVSNYLGLPLYATTCCAVAGPSSSSSSSALSSSSSVLGGIQRQSLGIGSTLALQPELVLPQVKVQTGLLLAIVTTAGGASLSRLLVTFGGTAMSRDRRVVFPFSTVTPTLAVYHLGVQAQTADLVLETQGAGLTAFMCLVVGVTGLVRNALDVTQSGQGTTGTAPDTGASATTTFAAEYAQGAFLLLNETLSPAWQNSFSSGQSFNTIVEGNFLEVLEGFRILSATTTIRPALSPSSNSGWAGIGTTYS
jgi:hypothetical protein